MTNSCFLVTSWPSWIQCPLNFIASLQQVKHAVLHRNNSSINNMKLCFIYVKILLLNKVKVKIKLVVKTIEMTATVNLLVSKHTITCTFSSMLWRANQTIFVFTFTPLWAQTICLVFNGYRHILPSLGKILNQKFHPS